jgi:hypothetical protein
MTATGGAAGVSSGAAGTVYTETPSQGAGRGNLIVDNRVLQPTLQTNMTYYPATYPDTPPTISNELARVAVTVTNTGWFRLAADAQVRDIHVMSANSVLDLKSRTLTVTSFEHPLGAGTVTNYGAIVWVPPLSGVLLMVR